MKDYRTLNPDEIIQEGDQINRWGEWDNIPSAFWGRHINTVSCPTRRPIFPEIDPADENQCFRIYYNVTSRRMLDLYPNADLERVLELVNDPIGFVNGNADGMGVVIDDEYSEEDERTNGGFSLCVIDQDGYESQIWEEVPELSEDAVRRLGGDLAGLSEFDQYIYTAYSIADEKEQGKLLRAFPEKFLKQ